MPINITLFLIAEILIYMFATAQVWHFDMLNLPNSTESKSLDVCFTSRGTFNTVMFWCGISAFLALRPSVNLVACVSGANLKCFMQV